MTETAGAGDCRTSADESRRAQDARNNKRGPFGSDSRRVEVVKSGATVWESVRAWRRGGEVVMKEVRLRE